MLKGGLGGMMKKAQEMQENMQKMQEELATKTVIGQAGAGAVEIIMNGHFSCQRVTLSEEALKEDKEILEALIAAAVNDAAEKVKALTQTEMGSLTAGLNLPAGFKLPF
ncbi:YbaB/EbfC family nucleoid-associated protein [Suttonella ornithocola]|uniref:Nucleoid-associated protein NCTC13337_02589 n=1 Tax=Suttonella ornithocola TaxID=279832 RepID=A0A380MYT9_9GAMM|nr:YbaB/EbfC family nucleoid-associated protein [Suttonella ornithocola]SUO97730.1 DNA-binding protein, YbaB/EbfC family [Suttonella ornithocola]